ncbi:hypothetical protein TSUD_341560 [Trifolium subterraneum]|uniref:Uncharacterized protein n=1 Tax=Trifolium subterraneum TaxID=3900 RepID=A0A2Z6P006_TRISU|nr:hypothetical protein TSUD_341560 [Trifolium subterraneum]
MIFSLEILLFNFTALSCEGRKSTPSTAYAVAGWYEIASEVHHHQVEALSRSVKLKVHYMLPNY